MHPFSLMGKFPADIQTWEIDHYEGIRRRLTEGGPIPDKRIIGRGHGEELVRARPRPQDLACRSVQMRDFKLVDLWRDNALRENAALIRPYPDDLVAECPTPTKLAGKVHTRDVVCRLTPVGGIAVRDKDAVADDHGGMVERQRFRS